MLYDQDSYTTKVFQAYMRRQRLSRLDQREKGVQIPARVPGGSSSTTVALVRRMMLTEYSEVIGN